MTTKKKLGRIERVEFGLGGYQDCCLGLHVTLSGESWGVSSTDSFWDFESIKHSESCKWTDEGREREAVSVLRKLSLLLKQAKKSSVHELKGIPVECEFDGMMLKSWRVLTEVL